MRDNLSETRSLSEDQKRDVLFNLVMRMLPEIQLVQFLTQSTKSHYMTNDEIKLFVIQTRTNHASVNRVVTKAKREIFERYFQ